MHHHWVDLWGKDMDVNPAIKTRYFQIDFPNAECMLMFT